MLGEFEIKSKQIKISGTNLQGYQRADFADARNATSTPLPQEILPLLPTLPNWPTTTNLVGSVGSVGPTREGDDDIEPGSFEPEDHPDIPDSLDRRGQ